jgi:hypothetical protein
MDRQGRVVPSEEVAVKPGGCGHGRGCAAGDGKFCRTWPTAGGDLGDALDGDAGVQQAETQLEQQDADEHGERRAATGGC